MSASITPWRAFPADPADWFDADEVAKAKRYVRPLHLVNGAAKAADLAAAVLIVTTHLVPNLLGHFGWTNWVVRLVVAVAVLLTIESVVAAPFGAWQSLSYNRRWGFSTQRFGGWLADQAKSLPLGLVVTIVLFLPMWAIVRATPLWWIWSWALFAFFTVVFNMLFPVVIAPIFNKYTPLADEALRARLLETVAQVDADISEFLVEDASKRDTRQNAYVAGIGRTRRVVIYDTMLDWSHDEIANVVAHEIGHWKLRHLRRLLGAAIAVSFVSFAILKLVMEWPTALRWAGVASLRDPAALPLFLLVFTLVTPLTGLGVSWLSRVDEREADLFALAALRQPAEFVSMMRRLHTATLSDLAPSLWRRIKHSHPPAAERMAMGTAWGRANGLLNERRRRPLRARR